MHQLQDDGKIKGPSGNVLDLGKGAGDPIVIQGSTVLIPGTVVFGPLGQSLPAGTAAATNTTVVVAGTTAATIKLDSKFDGSLGTVPYTVNDLVRALKLAGVIAT